MVKIHGEILCFAVIDVDRFAPLVAFLCRMKAPEYSRFSLQTLFALFPLRALFSRFSLLEFELSERLFELGNALLQIRLPCATDKGARHGNRQNQRRDADEHFHFFPPKRLLPHVGNAFFPTIFLFCLFVKPFREKPETKNGV